MDNLTKILAVFFCGLLCILPFLISFKIKKKAYSFLFLLFVILTSLTMIILPDKFIVVTLLAGVAWGTSIAVLQTQYIIHEAQSLFALISFFVFLAMSPIYIIFLNGIFFNDEPAFEIFNLIFTVPVSIMLWLFANFCLSLLPSRHFDDNFSKAVSDENKLDIR